MECRHRDPLGIHRLQQLVRLTATNTGSRVKLSLHGFYQVLILSQLRVTPKNGKDCFLFTNLCPLKCLLPPPSMMLFSLSGNLIHTRLASLSLGSVGQVGAGSLSLMLMTYFCTKCAQDPPPSRLNSYRVVFWEVIYRVILNIPFVFHPEYLFSPCSESQPQLRNYSRKKHFFKEKSVRSILKQIFFYICLLKIQDHFCC